MRSLRIPSNGLEQHLLEWTDSAERAGTAMLLHGFMDAAGTWDLVAPSLVAAGLRVLALDMRGFGDGPRAPDGSYYHFADYVADLAGVLDAALAPARPPQAAGPRAAASDAEPLFLVGHSMGGTIASLYAGTMPERVTKLALLEGVGPPDNTHDVAPTRMRKWLDDLRATKESGAIAREDALRRLVMNHAGIDRAILETRLPHLTRDAGDGKVSWRFDPLHKTRSPVPFFAQSYIAFARLVTCPVLFVSGGANGYHPPDEDARLAAFKHVERFEIPDAGHMLHWTRPRELSQRLVEFWRG